MNEILATASETDAENIDNLLPVKLVLIPLSTLDYWQAISTLIVLLSVLC